MNKLKKMAKTPILFSVDGEWGLAMRMPDSIISLPRQMMMGATSDSSLMYEYGKIVANQCKRMGIQMNYAPVIDVNNNPDNPVINDRSFGEHKEKVSSFGIQYIKGMEENGVMACVKHFPGHGDVAVDSHLDLPIINKTQEELSQLEWYPFEQAFNAGVSSVMIGHLYIPSIDNRTNRATSLSKYNIDTLLKQKMKFDGLAITDGLEMKGVKKFFPNGEIAVQAILAGNDLLCLPDSIPQVIEKIIEAIAEKRISWDEIEGHVKKVLHAKYKFVLPQNDTIALENLTADINDASLAYREKIADRAITLLTNEDAVFFPLDSSKNFNKIAYLAVGIGKGNAMTKKMEEHYGAKIFYLDFKTQNTDSINLIADSLIRLYSAVIIGIHQINRAPANNFGMSKLAVDVIQNLQQKTKTFTLLFGNAYAAKNWPYAPNFAVGYEDDSIVHKSMMKLLKGKNNYRGTLPVSVSENFTYGHGIVSHQNILIRQFPENQNKFLSFQKIDSLAADAIKKKALPGCVVLGVQHGKVIFEKAYGAQTYQVDQPLQANAVFDLASLTKILSTTLAVMKLCDQEKLLLDKPIGDYLPELKNTNKYNLTAKQLLLHEAGLTPYVPFYKETLNEKGLASENFYNPNYNDEHRIQVAQNLFADKKMVDSFYQKIINSNTKPGGDYVYSDNDFIFLMKIVERITGKTLQAYVEETFYNPMGLSGLTYKPLDQLRYERIVPSTFETGFRQQELRGFVHDQGAAIMGGVSGHAGLFGNAYDVACIMQMLLNGGSWNGENYIKPETISVFTSYQSKSRRGLGFDKPERDNQTRTEAYPCTYSSASTFGHTGFTGTCTWADPNENLIFVFLSNRIYDDTGVFKTLNLRSKIQDCLYEYVKEK
jgi:beta-glucosidase-like glycosyl hydrolase/CubicO group peptidase (beta-lactamase class C family)